MPLRSAITLSLVMSAAFAYGQSRLIEGVVTDDAGGPIPGARVAAVSSGLPVVTDDVGRYRLPLPEDADRIEASAPGYDKIEAFVGTVGRVDLVLERGLGLGEAVGLGGLRPGRSIEEETFAVEVVYAADEQVGEPYATLGQVLTFATSSLRALPRASGSTADFVDPVGFSGGGPGQVVTLVNGHRRHRSALLPTGDVFARGRPSYDLATIPLAAVARVEVLRGPAAAVYGADAAVGVVNVVLKRASGLAAVVDLGAHLSGGVPAAGDNPDGRFGQLALAYGRALGRRGGFAHVTAAVARRERTNRAGAIGGPIFSGYNNPDAGETPGSDITDAELQRRGLTRQDFRASAGQAAQDRASVVANAELVLDDTWTAYGFGDYSYRLLGATAPYALPNEARTNTTLYPDGFAPELSGALDDQSAVLGVRGRYRGWELDASNGFGRSGVELEGGNTANASLGADSPREFDAGGAAFWHNTIGAEARRRFPETMSGLSLSGGLGYRIERYNLYAGQSESYGRGGTGTDPLGRVVPGGAQGLRGTSDRDAGDEVRHVGFGYADAQLDVVPRVTVAAGVRYERYDDLGGGAMADVRARVGATDDVSLRGSLSTGFRAPTLQEARYRSTLVAPSGLREGVFGAGSEPARALGIGPLALERHVGASGGVTARWARFNLEFGADAFFVDVEDAVVLTGAFGVDPSRLDVDRRLAEVGVDRARFLVNAVDTRTGGVTASLRHAGELPRGIGLRVDGSFTYARTGVRGVNVSPALANREGVYLPADARTLFDAAVPRLRAVLAAYLDYGDFALMARGNYFGAVEAPINDPADAQTYGAVPVADVSLTWRTGGALAITAGASNVLDAYPDGNAGALLEDGRSPYPRAAQQFGANGRYVFARLSYGLPR